MHAKKLQAQDLLDSIYYVSGRSNSADTIHTLSRSPIHVLVYNEILKYSKKDLEAVKSSHEDTIYDLLYASRNPFLFSSILEKNAFTSKLSKDSKWLLSQEKNPSLDLYDVVFRVEQERGKDKTPEFIQAISSYLLKMDTSEKINVANNFYDDYMKKNTKLLTYIAFREISSNFSDFLLDKMKKDKIDINQDFLMNSYLPKQESHITENVDKSFFISSLHFEKMGKQLKKGFIFDEENYSFHGQTLMTALLNSKRVETVELLLPYLKKTQPKNITMDQQHALLDSFQKEKSYKDLKITYYKLVYDNLIQEKPEDITLPKIKI